MDNVKNTIHAEGMRPRTFGTFVIVYIRPRTKVRGYLKPKLFELKSTFPLKFLPINDSPAIPRSLLRGRLLTPLIPYIVLPIENRRSQVKYIYTEE